MAEEDTGAERCNRGGWQSDSVLWKEPLFEPLMRQALEVAGVIVREMGANQPEMIIRALWGNINPTGGFNFTHVHPSGWMSGVYYLQLPEGNNVINFEDPRPARMMDFQRNMLSRDCFYSHFGKVGQLLLFPSWLPHHVAPNTSDESRISLAFNIELLV